MSVRPCRRPSGGSSGTTCCGLRVRRGRAARLDAFEREGVRAAAGALPPDATKQTAALGGRRCSIRARRRAGGLQIPGASAGRRCPELPGRQPGAAIRRVPRAADGRVVAGLLGWVEGADGGAGAWARRRGEQPRSEVRARCGAGHGRDRSRPRAQWIFEAGPFRVTVHGTSFTIAWNPVDAVFEVRLASGAISVASPVAGPEIQMRAGQTLRVSLRDQSSTLGSLATMSGGREVPSPAESAPASTSFEPPRTAPRGPAEPPRWSHRGWMSALSDNRARDILADAERRDPTSVIERADSEDLWALANAARYAGRHALAGQA